jgi:predicted Zn-dependent protease with MMP-like domain
MRVPPEEFEALVEQALDGLPEEFAELLDNIVVMVEDEPDPEDVGPGPAPLGIYMGTALTQRDSFQLPGLPDRIIIYRGPILRICKDRRQVIREVRDTVVHELGHYFGMEEKDMPY